MGQYKKAVVAFIGMLGTVSTGTAFEMPPEVQEWLVDLVFNLLIVVGVFAVKNDDKPSQA